MNATTAELNLVPTKIDLQLRKAFLNKLSRIKDAQLTIQDPLGTVVLGEPAKDGLSAKIVVKNLDFYRQIALNGSIGAAESYMDHGWEADNLTGVIQILVRNRDLLDSMEGGLAATCCVGGVGTTEPSGLTDTVRTFRGSGKYPAGWAEGEPDPGTDATGLPVLGFPSPTMRLMSLSGTRCPLRGAF